MKRPLPTRTLRERPHLDQLKRQAKELLEAFRRGEAQAVAEVSAHFRNAVPARFALHDAQLVLARAYGFESWPKLEAYVDGVTVQRLAGAVRGGDVRPVRAMLEARPELVNLDLAANNEHRALHYAVLDRMPEMVRLLMEHGADARKGIYPHRDATSALTLASERGYDEIVAIIRAAEQGRRAAPDGGGADELSEAIMRGDLSRARAMLESDPALTEAANRGGWTPLQVASAMRDEGMVEWLLARGAEVNRCGPGGRTALDQALGRGGRRLGGPERFQAVAGSLRQRGAGLTARAAVAPGEADWLRARYAEGATRESDRGWGRAADDSRAPRPSGDARVAAGPRFRPE